MAMNCNQNTASLNCKLFILILIFATINRTTSLEEGDACTTNSGKAGTCLELGKCQNIGELMRAKESPVTCGFGVYDEIICCPNTIRRDTIEVPTRHKITTTTTTFISMFSTTIPIKTTSGKSKKPAHTHDFTSTKRDTIGNGENPFLPERKKSDEIKIRNPWLPQFEATNISNVSRHQTTSRAPPDNNKPIIFPNDIGYESTTKSTVSTRSKERPATIACSEIEKGLTPSLTTHILGGETVDLGEYPHMASLGYSDLGGDEYDFRCGGTLIAPRYILTAAHCVIRQDMSPSIVRLGVAAMDDPVQVENAVDRSIKKVHIHPEYTNGKVYNDIAILELNRDVEYSDKVYPACLSTDPEYPSEKSIITVTGWGVMNVTTRAVSKILLKAKLGVVSLSSCNKEYTNSRQLPQGVIESQMCAVDEKGIRDACQGDSGGPLNLVVDESLRKYKIIGITSVGYGCGSLIPGLYTRVSAYLDYIESVVWPTSSSN